LKTEFALVNSCQLFFQDLGVALGAHSVVIAPSLPKNYRAVKSLEKSS